MQFAEEGPLNGIAFGQPLPPLPGVHELDASLEAFSRSIYPLYPVFDLTAFRLSAERISCQDLQQLSNGDVPVLSSLYARLALVTDETVGKYTTSSYAYLSAAYSLSAYIASFPYFPSVQAFLLLAIALRARNKDGAAWQTLGQAIRIAQSIGLHRRFDSGIVQTPGTENWEDADEELGSRIWWICYCLEKTIGLEVGRPLSIRDGECNQVKPLADPTYMYLINWIGLSQIQSRLLDVLYHRPPEKRNANDLLQDIGSIDRELCDWVAAVEPEEIRPTSDLLCADEELHLASFLAMEYYQTLITVHQAALMVDTKTYQSKIAQHCQNRPWMVRLRASESILLNAARRIGALQIELVDRRLHSKLITVTKVMLAMMVIELNIMRNPDLRRNKLDTELLIAMSLHAERKYTSAGQRQDFIEAVRILRGHVRLQVPAIQQQGHAINENHPITTPNSFGSGEYNYNEFSSIPIGNLINASIPDPPLAFGEDFPLDHPWDWLLSDDTGISPTEYPPFWSG